MHKVDLLFKCKNILGEGITWSSESQKLFWLDIGYISKLFKLDISSDKKEVFEFPEIITASSVKSKNEIILLSNNGLNIFNFSKKNFQTIVEIEKSIIDTRSNDGASDALGRFWCGSMQNNFDKFGNNIPVKKNIGKLYRVDINKDIKIIDENLGIPNTFVWSPDNSKFYFTDTLNGMIINYDFNLLTGELSNKQDFAKFERGFPDGSTMDTDGCLWNCRWGGSCIVRFTPSGAIDQIIEMPVKNITNCVFGGNDMKTLFVTTARNKDKNQNDLDGSLFAINTNYQGLQDNKSKLSLD